jgi:hypothetical protein
VTGPVRVRTLAVAVLFGAASVHHPVAAQRTTYVDPVPYCRDVGTIDRPTAAEPGRRFRPYLWRCSGSEPVAARQVLQVDRDGYPAAFWHAVAP